MNPRERILALGVLAIIVVAVGAFLFHQLFFEPLQNRNASIVAMQDDLEKKEERVRQINAERQRLARYRQLSLPADANVARREYEKYLSELLRQCGVPGGSFTVTAQPIDAKSSPAITGKGPVYTKLPFAVQAHADLGVVVAILEKFYKTGLLHQIRNLQIQRPLTTSQGQRQGELDLTMRVEALIVAGTEPRAYLVPHIDRRLLAAHLAATMQRGPAALAYVPWIVGPTGPLGPGLLAEPPRQYATIASKNIFTGPPLPPATPEPTGDEVEVTQFVHLTDITHNALRSEAFLYDRYNNRKTRLRAEPGFDSFRVQDGEGETLLRGRVIRIDQRDLVFRVDENYYSIHVGQSLEEVLKSPLKPDQLKEILPAVAAPAKPAAGP